jgi:hypothetical protein
LKSALSGELTPHQTEQVSPKPNLACIQYDLSNTCSSRMPGTFLSCRGDAVGKIMTPGWRIITVGGGGGPVSTKPQLASALHRVNPTGAGATIDFTLRQVGPEQPAAASSVSGGAAEKTMVLVALARHAKHGYGLDLSDGLVVESIRSPAVVRFDLPLLIPDATLAMLAYSSRAPPHVSAACVLPN